MLKLSKKKLEGIVCSEDRARKILNRLHNVSRDELIGFDTETTGWDPREKITPYFTAKCCVFSLSDGKDSWCIDGKLLKVFKPLFEDPAVRWAGVNLKFDIAVLWNHGIDLGGKWYDGRILSLLNDESALNRHGLKQMSDHYLGIRMVEFKDLLGTKKRVSTEDILAADPWLLAEYARKDAVISAKLCNHLVGNLKRLSWKTGNHSMLEFYENFEEPFTHVLVGMEKRGIRLNVDAIGGIEEKIEEEDYHLRNYFERKAQGPIDLASPDQVGHLLFTKLKMQPTAYTDTKRCTICEKKATKRTQYVCKEHGEMSLELVPSTKGAALQQLADRGHEVAIKLMRWRKINQIYKTFLPNLRKVSPDGKLHTTWNQGGAETWRLSSSAPNLMNIPRSDNDDPNHPDPNSRGFGLRDLFLPDEGKVFVVADFGQVEMRIGAHLANDPTLIDAYRSGRDIHSEAAIALFNLTCSSEDVKKLHAEKRSLAKVFNFGVFYGAGATRVSNTFKCSKQEAQDYIDNYFATFRGIRAYRQVVEKRVTANHQIRSLLGRYRRFPRMKQVSKTDREFFGMMREATNYGCQAGAADIIQTVMTVADGHEIEWHPLKQATGLKDLDARILLQIHDELVLQVPEDNAKEAAKELELLMTDPVPGMKVPIVADAGIGHTWNEAKV